MISAVLDQLADVYVETTATGKFTTRTISGMPCRMVTSKRLAHEQDQRVELINLRTLMFDGAYSIPEHCQIDIGDGARWAPRAGTFSVYRDWLGTTTYKTCWIERQQVTAF